MRKFTPLEITTRGTALADEAEAMAIAKGIDLNDDLPCQRQMLLTLTRFTAIQSLRIDELEKQLTDQKAINIAILECINTSNTPDEELATLKKLIHDSQSEKE